MTSPLLRLRGRDHWRWLRRRLSAAWVAFGVTDAGPLGKYRGIVCVLVLHDRVELAHDLHTSNDCLVDSRAHVASRVAYGVTHSAHGGGRGTSLAANQEELLIDVRTCAWVASMAVWKTIRDEIQGEVVLEKSLRPGEHQGKSSG